MSASHHEPGWRTSLHSIGDGQCVEVMSTGSSIFMRDSEDTLGPKLTLSINSWAALAAEIKTDTLNITCPQ